MKMNTFCYILIILMGLKGALSQSIMVNGNNTEPENVGGKPEAIENLPFIVAITYNDEGDYHEFRCAGSLYRLDLILTSAECLILKQHTKTLLKEKRVRVWAGSAYLNNITEYREVEELRIHEGYNSFTGQHNIGIIKLKSEFMGDDTIRVIGIKEGSFNTPLSRSTTQKGATCTIAGWGTGQMQGFTIYELRTAEAYVHDGVACAAEYSKKTGSVMTAHETFICFLSDDPKYNCLSDPGGPLICEDMLVGVFLYGQCKSDVSLPLVYTLVASYEDWIGGGAVAVFLTTHPLQMTLYFIILQYLSFYFTSFNM